MQGKTYTELFSKSKVAFCNFSENTRALFYTEKMSNQDELLVPQLPEVLSCEYVPGFDKVQPMAHQLD